MATKATKIIRRALTICRRAHRSLGGLAYPVIAASLIFLGLMFDQQIGAAIAVGFAIGVAVGVAVGVRLEKEQAARSSIRDRTDVLAARYRLKRLPNESDNDLLRRVRFMTEMRNGGQAERSVLLVDDPYRTAAPHPSEAVTKWFRTTPHHAGVLEMGARAATVSLPFVPGDLMKVSRPR
jgi:hypothetical protein